jgi:hypothetical protein
MKIPHQDDQIKGFLHRTELFERVDNDELVIDKADGKIIDDQVVRVGQKAHFLVLFQVLCAVESNDLTDLFSLAFNIKKGP